MHILWGCLLAAAGLFMLLGGLSKSDFVIYRLMAARSKILWGSNVHCFYQIVGVIVIVFGALVALGYIQRIGSWIERDLLRKTTSDRRVPYDYD